MKKLSKRILCTVVTAALVFGAQTAAFAAEDDITDEAEIYLNEQVIANRTAVTPDTPARDQVVEGTKVSDITNSPALSGSERVLVNSTSDEPEDENNEIMPINNSPNTGAPSMMLPIGVAFLSLGCLLALWRKERP